MECAKRTKDTKRKWRPPDLRLVPPIRGITEDAAWFYVFDALMHLGQGTPAQLGRLIGQRDGTSLGVDVMLRALEVLGHIDVVRDPQTLDLKEWETTPSTLVSVTEDRYVLIGRRTTKQVEAFVELVSYCKGAVDSGLDGQLPHLEVILKADTLAEIVSVLVEDGWTGLAVSNDPGLRIARALPPLSTLEQGLTRRPVPAFRQVERWDTASASWQRTRTIEETGAFRVTNHSRTYVLRSLEDLSRGTVGLTNVQVAKHVANAWAGDPLARYDDASGSVVVPLGADLPGLWGRALALCSGRQPVSREGGRIVQYPSVPREVADLVATSLAE